LAVNQPLGRNNLTVTAAPARPGAPGPSGQWEQPAPAAYGTEPLGAREAVIVLTEPGNYSGQGQDFSNNSGIWRGKLTDVERGKMKPLIAIAALGLIVSLTLVPHISYAGHDDDGHGNKHGHGKHDEGNWDHKHYKHHKHAGEYDYDYEHYGYHGPYFTAQRVTVIRNYYTPEEIDRLPPGLRKHLERTGHLPPGLEKKLVVNQPLPPGYLNYMVPAPPALVGTLGPLPPGSNLYFYNGDAVLINPRTQAVLDIVHGALTLGGH
jgi:hypothetical protein